MLINSIRPSEMMVNWPSTSHKHHRFLKETVFGAAGEDVVPDPEEDWVLSPEKGAQVTVCVVPEC